MIINRNYVSNQPIVKNKELKKENNIEKCENKRSDVNFGCISKLIKPTIKKAELLPNALSEISDLSNMLSVPREKLIDMCRGKKQKQISLLRSLTQSYNAYNYKLPKEQKEDSKIVLELFQRIDSPKDAHLSFINDTGMKVTDIKRCFDACKDDPKKIEKVKNLHDTVYTRNKNDFILQIVDSPNFEKHLEDEERIRNYLKVDKEQDGVIKRLDKLIENGSNILENEVAKKSTTEIIKMMPETPIFEKEHFINTATKEKSDILNSLRLKFNPSAEYLEAGDYKGIKKIFDTTNEKNFEFRKDFIEANYYNFGKRKDMGKNEINELAALFELADKEPKVEKFLTNISKSNSPLSGAAEYIKVLDKVNPERLNSNKNEVSGIIKSYPYECVDKLIERFNPKKVTFLDKIKTIFGGNKISEQVYPVSERISIDRMSEIKPVSEIKISKKEEIVKPVVEEIKQEVVKQQEITKPEVEEVKKDVVETKKPLYRFFKPFVPKEPSAKKLVVINDINKILEKNLGAKTLSEQKVLYAQDATKMRLGMLGEIFESIKDTRKAERAKGTFSRYKSVNNEEAICLYKRINGKTKKLVNYMLKKKNKDGSRVFSIRDIIDTLAEGNRTILKKQKLSTKENRFTSKDQKAVYDELFNKKVEQYGKR